MQGEKGQVLKNELDEVVHGITPRRLVVVMYIAVGSESCIKKITTIDNSTVVKLWSGELFCFLTEHFVKHHKYKAHADEHSTEAEYP